MGIRLPIQVLQLVHGKGSESWGSRRAFTSRVEEGVLSSFSRGRLFSARNYVRERSCNFKRSRAIY